MSPAQFQRFKQFCAIANQYTQEYPHEFQDVSGQQIWQDLIQVAMALGVVSNRQEFETGWNVLMAEEAFNLPAYEPNQEAEPEASQAEPLPEGMGGQIVSVLKAFRVQVDYLGEVPGPTFTRYQLKPRLGVKVSAISALATDLKVHLGLDAVPIISAQSGCVALDVPRPDRQFVLFEDYVQSELRSSPPSKITLALGVGLDGTLREVDISDANSCHLLVGGNTGGGKSGVIRAMLYSLFWRYSPELAKVLLISIKRSEFPDFQNIPWLYGPVVSEATEAVYALEHLCQVMDHRDRVLATARCKDIDVYNQKHPAKPMPRLLAVFDELADCICVLPAKTSKEEAELPTSKRLETAMVRIAQKARSTGIHLIVATQRPEASVLTPLIRSNLPGRIALRTKTDADSRMIFGNDDGSAVNLLGKGDCFLATTETERLQTLHVNQMLIDRFSDKYVDSVEPTRPWGLAAVHQKGASEKADDPLSAIVNYLTEQGGQTTQREIQRNALAQRFNAEEVGELVQQLENQGKVELSKEGKSTLISLSNPDNDN
ncbi:DNA translocase FtsK [Leptothoe spongobia]|uniref:FtsK domain-containing protein n=1 Tax=Leptothoe spongobia TAU-MAC 1115 TaxID=1967444 RepID=A0A947GJ50_9CYAN|nr:DNA translocase FtsK [Leptothoe spongobia]MBT9315417.1 hypothetical protein [Leptothoe spongobia TAU-MAC 1115]